MAAESTREIQPKEKRELTIPAEQTKPGLVFTPAVDIIENSHAITLLADMPGVKASDLNIDLRDNVLTLTGDVSSPEGPDEKFVIQEYETGKFYRQFTLSETVDQSKIEANLTDGVLRLKLPKVAAAQPRKIIVQGG